MGVKGRAGWSQREVPPTPSRLVCAKWTIQVGGTTSGVRPTIRTFPAGLDWGQSRRAPSGWSPSGWSATLADRSATNWRTTQVGRRLWPTGRRPTGKPILVGRRPIPTVADQLEIFSGWSPTVGDQPGFGFGWSPTVQKKTWLVADRSPTNQVEKKIKSTYMQTVLTPKDKHQARITMVVDICKLFWCPKINIRHASPWSWVNANCFGALSSTSGTYKRRC